MRKLSFLLIFLCISTFAGAQFVYPYGDIKLQKPGDYVATEPMALSAASSIITTPFAEADEKRKSAMKFLVDWMTGTKAYSFYTQGMAQDLRDDLNLLELFIAAMVKYSIENKVAAANPLAVDKNAAKMVIAYCDDPKNNFKLKKKFRKILERN
jgi:hypothetical protein